jgi:hypothetical protein
MKIRWKVGAWFLVLFLLCVPEVFAWPVPDTGQTKCYDNTAEIPCPALWQDFYGQDAQYQGPTRSYTKQGQNGVALADTATQESGWLMTRDNLTGLVWEMKTDDRGIHDSSNTYTWCDRNLAKNGGDEVWFQLTCHIETGSASRDTAAFIKTINDANFGGFSDWRLPTIKELSSLLNSGIRRPGPTIDAAWFPHTLSSMYWDWGYRSEYSSYWSSTADAENPGYAWIVYIDTGSVARGDKSNRDSCVRAVRAGQ